MYARGVCVYKRTNVVLGNPCKVLHKIVQVHLFALCFCLNQLLQHCYDVVFLQLALLGVVHVSEAVHAYIVNNFFKYSVVAYNNNRLLIFDKVSSYVN